MLVSLLWAPRVLAASRYWIGGSSTSWQGNQNWSATPGGAPCNCVPGDLDDAIFPNGGGTVQLNDYVSINNLRLHAAWTGTILIRSYYIYVNQDVEIAGGTLVGGVAPSGAGFSLGIVGNYVQTGGTVRGFQNDPVDQSAFICVGSFTVSSETGSAPVFSMTGTLVVASDYFSPTVLAVGSGASFHLHSLGQKVLIGSGESFDREVDIGSGTLSLSGPLAVDAGGLDLSSNNLNLIVGEGISLGSSASVVVDGDVTVQSGGIVRQGAGAFALSGATTLTLGGTADNFDALAAPLYNLVISPGADVTMSATHSLTNALTIGTGATLNIANRVLAATGAAIQNFGLITLTSGTLVHEASGLSVTDDTFSPADEFIVGTDRVYVTVTAADANLNGTAQDTLTVTGSLANGDGEAIELTETSKTSGLFRGSIDTAEAAPTAANGFLEVQSGTSALTVTFEDTPSSLEKTATGVLVVPAPPVLQSFTSTGADATYGPESDISIIATYDVTVRGDSALTVTMTNGVEVMLDSVSGATIIGTYSVGATVGGEDDADLGVASIDTESVFSFDGAEQTSSSIPSGENLSDNSNIAIDTTAPSLLTVLPADDATDVAVTADLLMTFDEDVVAVAGKELTIVHSDTAAAAETIAADGPQVTTSGSQVTIVRSISLDNATAYHVLVDAGTFRDSAGNAEPGITSSSVWNFTTIAAPASSTPQAPAGGGGGGSGARHSSITARIDRARAGILLRFANSLNRTPPDTQPPDPRPVPPSTPPDTHETPRLPPVNRILQVAHRRGRLVAEVEGSYVLYRDVPVTAWFAPYVAAVVENGIAQGYRDARGAATGKFGVANPVTRAELLKMAFESAEKPLAAGSPRNASAHGTWAAAYVKTAEDLSLSAFAPTVDVMLPASRGEVVQTILEVFDFPIANQAALFTDVPSHHRYSHAIATAAFHGLVVGDTDREGNALNRFRPDDPINRAEVSKLIALVQ